MTKECSVLYRVVAVSVLFLVWSPAWIAPSTGSLTLLAAAAGSTRESKPLAEPISSLAAFVGDWGCHGSFIKTGKPIASHVRFEPVLGGTWLEMQWDDAAPNHFHAVELWGFDTGTAGFRDFVFDNFAGGRLFTARGWVGDKLVWTGDDLAPGKELEQQFIFERQTPSMFVVTWRTRKRGEDWVVGDRLACRKTE